ncbi:GNAT family N-acetyltransferase [Aquimarina sp. 2201CG1-2-11]|uniref:GNAT family N-acetyltransferase n=1 Tax=Aquimarina discodermiae TaxID=3231043 RepID=UPI00346195D9
MKQILHLQQSNLPVSISESEKQKEGFLTVKHDLTILAKMNSVQQHIIAKNEDKVIGYALCMTKDFKNDIPVLEPMFVQVDNVIDVSTSYITMGQICVDKEYRRQGVFRGLYQKMKEQLKGKYDLLITEVDADNLRSLQAHYAVGFEKLTTYEASGATWQVVCWDWA